MACQILIDGDPLVYGCGFAVQKKDPKTGEVEAEPVSHAFQALRVLINYTVDDVTSRLRNAGDTVTKPPIIFLSGATNYRFRLATIRQYKGTRDPLHKPVHYDAMRLFLRTQYKAVVTDGNEADDELSIAQHWAGHEETVICTIDKDLQMVPGLHYNYRKKTFQIISPLQARRAFYHQLITGDPVDNIGGCYKAGKKTASEVLDKIKEVTVENYSLMACGAVLDLYAKSIVKYGDATRYAHMGAEAAVMENARLLWMQTEPGELWVPPGAKPEYLKGYPK